MDEEAAPQETTARGEREVEGHDGIDILMEKISKI
jgi:hypothetical protein